MLRGWGWGKTEIAPTIIGILFPGVSGIEEQGIVKGGSLVAVLCKGRQLLEPTSGNQQTPRLPVKAIRREIEKLSRRRKHIARGRFETSQPSLGPNQIDGRERWFRGLLAVCIERLQRGDGVGAGSWRRYPAA